MWEGRWRSGRRTLLDHGGEHLRVVAGGEALLVARGVLLLALRDGGMAAVNNTHTRDSGQGSSDNWENSLGSRTSKPHHFVHTGRPKERVYTRWCALL